ncbi:hypothetical protein B0T36_20035 [Nocardia donostiensis]|nr:hypothetical protein B0T36_20035 [Nocardia donostiensis]
MGSVWVVRFGCFLTANGMTVILCSPVLAVTVLSRELFGLGNASGVPQVLSAAGNTAGMTATDFSRVIGCGYVPMLAGPALIGWLAEATSLHHALVVVL